MTIRLMLVLFLLQANSLNSCCFRRPSNRATAAQVPDALVLPAPVLASPGDNRSCYQRFMGRVVGALNSPATLPVGCFVAGASTGIVIAALVLEPGCSCGSIPRLMQECISNSTGH